MAINYRLAHFLLVFLFFIGLTPFLEAQAADTPHFARRIVWSGGDHALRYAVEIDRLENGTYQSHLRDFTMTLYIDVSLPQGDYRFCIIPHDILDRPADGTQWFHFEVRPPVIGSESEQMQVISIEDSSVHIYSVNMEKQEEDTHTKERKARNRNHNVLSEWGTWDKWVYLGGGMGLGDGIFIQGLTADFALTRFFSVEVMPSIGLLDGIFSVIPIMGKWGWRFAKVELSADVGYTPLWGFTVGGTFGLNSNANSSFFAKFIAVPFHYAYEHSKAPFMYGFLGAKVGMGNRRR